MLQICSAVNRFTSTICISWHLKRLPQTTHSWLWGHSLREQWMRQVSYKKRHIQLWKYTYSITVHTYKRNFLTFGCLSQQIIFFQVTVCMSWYIFYHWACFLSSIKAFSEPSAFGQPSTQLTFSTRSSGAKQFIKNISVKKCERSIINQTCYY